MRRGSSLEAIGHPYAALPKTPTKDISPRVGFAYDLGGDGRRVLRGGYGLYFDQYNTGAAGGDITVQNRRPLNALATLTNTAIGVGQLATYRFGIDPLPPQPTEGNSLPRGSAGQWMGPNIDGSARAPGAHRLRPYAGGEHDGLGRLHARRRAARSCRQLNINPIVNGAAAAGAGLHPGLRDCRTSSTRSTSSRRSTSRGTTR